MKKRILRILIITGVLILIIHIGLVLTDNTHLYKGVASTYLSGESGPTIDDYSKFENRRIKTGVAEPWERAEKYNEIPDPEKLKTTHKELETVAFLILKKGKILHEKYYDGYDEESLTNSFSMAKTFVGLLTGIALEEGHIESLDDPVKKYLPEFTRNEKLKIRHLLSMTSGINFDESYNHPLGYMAKTYYGDDIKRITYQYEVTETPGKTFRYLGGNTLLLAMILEKTTGKTVGRYFQDKIWKEIGAENQALWTVDEKGLERAFCCFYSNARDYARLGQLMLDSGRWNGQKIIPSSHLRDATQSIDAKTPEGEPVDFYGYHIWLYDYQGVKGFFARGILGQYIIVIPRHDLVVVRLGRKRSETYRDHHPLDVYYYIESAIEISKAASEAK